jgi:anti-sigma B factor antagonist
VSVNCDIEVFDIAVTEDDRAAVLSVTGELDLATAPRLQDEFISLITRGVLHLTLDMASLDFIDSSGMAVLLTTRKLLHAHDGSLTLRSPNPSAQRALEVTGLTKIFAIT